MRNRLLHRAVARRLPNKRPFRLLWTGESIFNLSQIWSDVSGRFPNDGAIHEKATYGGNYVGGILLELADETQAYISAAWTAQTRETAWSDFQAVIIQTGRNDAGLGTNIDVFRLAIDKAVRQALDRVPQVILSTPPPLAQGGLAGWEASDPLADYLTEFDAVLTSYVGLPLVDLDQNFRDLVTAATYTVAQLMRDAYHPTLTTGATLIGGYVAAALRNRTAVVRAAPELAGSVKNYLYGNPTVGSWALAGTGNTTGPNDGPLPRIAGLADRGMRISSNGAKLTFPTVTVNENAQVWVHYYTKASSGGTFTAYVDRGLGSEVSAAVNTTSASVTDNYPRCALVAGNIAAGSRTIELETTSANQVTILGVTVAGVA